MKGSAGLVPEGERSPTGRLLPFRPGIGLLLSRFPRPVVPVAIHGTREALPRGHWLIRPRPVLVTFGDPVESARLVAPGTPPEEAARRIVRALETAVAELGRGRERAQDRVSPCLVTRPRNPVTSLADLAVARGVHEAGTLTVAAAVLGWPQRIRRAVPTLGNTQEEAP
jgi:1-acyl-sn-glycerol-3-phosphate acyltransferase